MSEATDLLLWGIVVHLVCDWLLQNEWMALNKMKRRWHPYARVHWWDRHPAAYVHAGIHTLGLMLVFPWYAALVLGLSHLIIDCRWIVASWSKLIRQTQPNPTSQFDVTLRELQGDGMVRVEQRCFDIGSDVRIWVDQVWHIAALAIAALALS